MGILADAINADTGANFARTDIAKSLDGDGWGYGFNLGALWEINGKHRFGLSYRSKVDVDFEGDYYSDIPSAISMPGETVTGDLTLNLPSITEFSGFHQITDPLAIHYSVMMTGWDVFEEIRATVDGQEVLQRMRTSKMPSNMRLGQLTNLTHPSLCARVLLTTKRLT